MFSIDDRPYSLCDRISRRQLLRVGALNLAGLSLPALLAAQARGAATGDATLGRAKNIIYLWLQGGPPQHETFDPKPAAPLEIRGPFQPISTNVPGIQFCELLPRTAAMADKLAVIRSISTDDNTHDTSGYWILTGNKYEAATAARSSPPIGRTSVRSSRCSSPATRVPALEFGLDSRRHAAQRQRSAGRTDRWFSGSPVGSRSVHLRSLGRQLSGRGSGPATAICRRCDCRAACRLFDQVGRHFDSGRASARGHEFRRRFARPRWDC